MTDPTTRSVVDVADGLRLTVGRLARHLRQQSLGGLTPSQRSVLNTLHRHGEMTMSELADHERISRPSATGIVGRLEERGMLKRSRTASDRRSLVVDLTSQGSLLVLQTSRERTAFLAEELAKLDTSDLTTLERAIEIFNQMLDRDQ